MAKKANSSDVTELQNFFKDRRSYWIERVNNLSSRIKKIDKLVETEIEIRNEIMNIIDEKSDIVSKLISLTKKIRKDKETHLYSIKTETDFRIKNNNEQIILLESKIAETLEKQELLEMQIEFIERTYINLKDLMWGIKNYIELYKQGIESK